MYQEHKLNSKISRVEDGPRALLAGLLLLAPQIPAISNALAHFLNPSSTIAAELNKPQEQQPNKKETEQELAKIIQAAENLDLKTFLSYLPNGQVNWQMFGEDQKPNSKAEITKRLEYVLTDPPPKCLGVRWLGRNNPIPMLLFKDLAYLGKTDHSYITLNFRSGRWVISEISEVPRDWIEREKVGLEPCPRLEQTQKQAQLEAEQEGDFDLPPSIKTLSMVFERPTTSGGITIYSAKATGEAARELVTSRSGEYRRAPVKIGDFVYFETATPQGFSLQSLNTKTGKVETIETGTQIISACPTEHPKGGIIYSRNYQGVWEVVWRRGQNVETLIGKNQKLLSCPKISLDGNFIIYQTQAGLGIKYAQDNFQKETILKQGSVVALDVSKKDSAILYRSPSKHDYEPESALFVLDPKLNKEIQIAKNTVGGSFDPTGDYVIYSQVSESGRGYDVFVYSRGENRRQKLFNTQNALWFPVLEKNKQPLLKTVAVNGGFTTEFIGAMVGQYTSDTFDDLYLNLYDRDFRERGVDFMRLTPTGGYFREDGSYVANSSDCLESLTHPEQRAQSFIQFLRSFQNHHPDRKLIVVTHSDGISPIVLALKYLKDNNIRNIDLSLLEIVALHAPIAGVDLKSLEFIADRWPFSMASDCYTRGTTLPSIRVLESPAGKYLLYIWQNRKQWRQETGEIIDWFIDQGGKATAIGNLEDGAIDLFHFWQPRWWIANRISEPDAQENQVIYSQQFPSKKAKNIMSYFGKNHAFGHGEILQTEEGRSAVLPHIGPQTKK